jgi:hypothetical protein
VRSTAYAVLYLRRSRTAGSGGIAGTFALLSIHASAAPAAQGRKLQRDELLSVVNCPQR